VGSSPTPGTTERPRVYCLEAPGRHMPSFNPSRTAPSPWLIGMGTLTFGLVAGFAVSALPFLPAKTGVSVDRIATISDHRDVAYLLGLPADARRGRRVHPAHLRIRLQHCFDGLPGGCPVALETGLSGGALGSMLVMWSAAYVSIPSLGIVIALAVLLWFPEPARPVLGLRQIFGGTFRSVARTSRQPQVLLGFLLFLAARVAWQRSISSRAWATISTPELSAWFGSRAPERRSRANSAPCWADTSPTAWIGARSTWAKVC
jgi:hypothetical protein